MMIILHTKCEECGALGLHRVPQFYHLGHSLLCAQCRAHFDEMVCDHYEAERQAEQQAGRREKLAACNFQRVGRVANFSALVARAPFRDDASDPGSWFFPWAVRDGRRKITVARGASGDHEMAKTAALRALEFFP